MAFFLFFYFSFFNLHGFQLYTFICFCMYHTWRWGGGGFGGLSFVCLAGFGVVVLIFMKRNWNG